MYFILRKILKLKFLKKYKSHSYVVFNMFLKVYFKKRYLIPSDPVGI